MPALAEARQALGRAVERYLPTRLPAPSLRGVISHNPWNYLKLGVASLGGLALVACSNEPINPVAVVSEPNRPVDVGGAAVPGTPESPTATATISLTPGIGGGDPIPTFEPDHPRAGENEGIIEANRKAAEEEAKAKAKQSSTPVPEAEKKSCFIDDVEACKTARMVKIGGKEYVELEVKSGIPLVTRLDGEKTVNEGQDPFQGVRVSVVNRTTTEVEDFRGDIDAEVRPLWVPIANGSIVGNTKDGKIYVRFTKVDPAKGIIMDRERTVNWFPGILEQPITELTTATQSKPDISYKFEG